MTDKELLELAAKAAGFQNFTMRDDTVFVETGSRRGDSGYYWNPLTDDGDALRLAVKLGIDIDPWLDRKITIANHIEVSGSFSEEHNGDPYAATRRAIVRAAAEIGKNN